MKIECLKLRLWLGCCALLCCFSMLGAGVAGELKEGTVIKAENLNEMLNETFEGKTIESLLTEKIKWMVEEKGLTLPLRHSEEVPKDPRWVEATKKYSGSVKLDPGTRDVTGYQAGLAFPDISEDDPHLALKIMYNVYYSGGWSKAEFQYCDPFIIMTIDGDKGLDRIQKWVFLRIFMKGRLNGPPVIGDGSIYYKQIMLALEPYDIRGIGAFRIRYEDGRLENAWAYLRSVRRTRRLTGGSWMDPIGGTDQLNDETPIWAGDPVWFPDFKYIGKRYILGVTHSRGVSWDESNPDNEFPNVDLKNKPYWNPINDWEPREVWVVEATMPDEHPESKKILYIDADTWMPYIAEIYNKKGEFERMLINCHKPQKGADSPESIGLLTEGFCINFNRNHATLYMDEKQIRNPQGIGPDDVTLGVMEAIAKGKWKSPVKK